MNNSAIRARAKQLVAANWGKMICMSLLIGLMSTLSFLGFLLAPLCACIYVSGLSLGHTSALLRMNDGEDVKITSVFALLRKGVSGCGLALWIGLKLFAWTLPGLALTVIGSLIAIAANSEGLLYVSSFLGSVLMFVFSIRASYSYAMAPYFMADQPELSCFEALNASKAFMQGRRFQLFRLTFFYALILLLILVVFIVLVGVFGMMSPEAAVIISILGTILLIPVSIFIDLLVTMSYATFFKMCSKPTATAQPNAQPQQQSRVDDPFDF